MPARVTVPVVLVAGFLGSGKTTLLNYVLTHNDGVRIGVVVNDFGAVNIDSMLVAGQVDSMISLGNGCLCCAVDVEDLDAMFDTLSRADIDVIVVEASGLAEPRTMIRLVLGSENTRIAFGGLITVVDAAEFERSAHEHPEIAAHLPLADLVVVNKSDRVSAERLTATLDAVRARGVDAPMVTTAFGAVDPRLLFDVPDRDRRSEAVQLTLDQLLRDDARTGCESGSGDHGAHLHSSFDSTVFRSDAPLAPREFVAFLEAPPSGLYRSKGFVDFGSRRFLVQTVGRHIRFDESQGRTSGGGRGTELVLIGAGLDVDAVREQLGRTRRDHDADDADLLPVYRYVARAPVREAETDQRPTHSDVPSGNF